jgi:hypothetical protein
MNDPPPPVKLPNWSLSAISHSFIELQLWQAQSSIHYLQMQFKKAVEDSKEGHAYLTMKYPILTSHTMGLWEVCGRGYCSSLVSSRLQGHLYDGRNGRS